MKGPTWVLSVLCPCWVELSRDPKPLDLADHAWAGAPQRAALGHADCLQTANRDSQGITQATFLFSWGRAVSAPFFQLLGAAEADRGALWPERLPRQFACLPFPCPDNRLRAGSLLPASWSRHRNACSIPAALILGLPVLCRSPPRRRAALSCSENLAVSPLQGTVSICQILIPSPKGNRGTC